MALEAATPPGHTAGARLTRQQAKPDDKDFPLPPKRALSIRALLPAIGAWRSLVAHLTGGQGVAGSNPVAPTNSLYRRVNAGHYLRQPQAATITGRT